MKWILTVTACLWLIPLLPLTLHAPSQLPPRWEAKVTCTAYCLTGTTTSGMKTFPGCIALSRDLAKNLGLYKGPGTYDYHFGTIVEIEGLGQFQFSDLMPPQWRMRVDIWQPGYKKAKAFGISRRMIRVVKHLEAWNRKAVMGKYRELRGRK